MNNTSSEIDTQAGLPRKKRRVACSRCRQSKLRCDSEHNPCLRCQRLGLTCEKSVAYKRVNRQSKIDELEQHVVRLRHLVGEGSDPRDTYSRSSSSALPSQVNGTVQNPDESVLHPRVHTNSGQNVTTNGQGQTSSMPKSNATNATPWEIGSIKLVPGQVASLFRIFFDRYHSFMPFLEPSRFPEQYFEGSPLLYWSIISVASRRYQGDSSLVTTLTPVVTSLLWATIPTSPLTLPNIQAVVLLCCWPFPATRFYTDKSILLANIAVTHALNIGLHRPGNEEEYTKTKMSMMQLDRLERCRTWAACSIIAQSLAVDLGYPPCISLTTWTINRACETGTGQDLPLELRHNLIINRSSSRAHQRMSLCETDPFGNPPDAIRYETLNVIEKEFDDVAKQLGSDISLPNKIRLSMTRLHAQNVYFLDSQFQEARKNGILKAYSTASSLISELIAEDDADSMLTYTPCNTVRSLFVAASVVWKIVNSSYHQDVDVQVGKVLFDAAAFALRQMSVMQNDVPIRAAHALKELRRMAETDLTLKDSPPRLRVQSRAGASVSYDILRTCRERRFYIPSQANFRAEGSSIQPESSTGTRQENGPATTNAQTLLAPSKSVSLPDLDLGLESWDNLPYIDWFWDYDYTSLPVT